MSHPLAACALIWNSDYTKFVGISRRDDPANMNLPGGKADGDESFAKACMREVHEELDLPAVHTTPEGLPNLRIRLYEGRGPYFQDVCYGETTYQVATFVSATTLDALPPAKEEGFVTRWITWEDLCQPSNSFHGYNTKLRDKWLQRSNYVETVYLLPVPKPKVSSSSCAGSSCAAVLQSEQSVLRDLLYFVLDPGAFEFLTLKLVDSPSEARFLVRAHPVHFSVYDTRLGLELHQGHYPDFWHLTELGARLEKELAEAVAPFEKAVKALVSSSGHKIARAVCGSSESLIYDCTKGLKNSLLFSDKLSEIACKIRTDHAKLAAEWHVNK